MWSEAQEHKTRREGGSTRTWIFHSHSVVPSLKNAGQLLSKHVISKKKSWKLKWELKWEIISLNPLWVLYLEEEHLTRESGTINMKSTVLTWEFYQIEFIAFILCTLYFIAGLYLFIIIIILFRPLLLFSFYSSSNFYVPAFCFIHICHCPLVMVVDSYAFALKAAEKNLRWIIGADREVIAVCVSSHKESLCKRYRIVCCTAYSKGQSQSVSFVRGPCTDIQSILSLFLIFFLLPQQNSVHLNSTCISRG